VAVDGILIDSVLSMDPGGLSQGRRKTRVHLGFDVNRDIPNKFFLTEGKAGEETLVDPLRDSHAAPAPPTASPADICAPLWGGTPVLAAQ